MVVAVVVGRSPARQPARQPAGPAYAPLQGVEARHSVGARPRVPLERAPEGRLLRLLDHEQAREAVQELRPAQL